MPKRYPPEVREKAVRLALDRLEEYGSAYAAAHAIGPRVDVHPETLRVWIVAALKRAAEKPKTGSGLDAAERAELERLRREVCQLREEREILRKAAAFFASMSGWIRPVGVLGSMSWTVAAPGCALVWQDSGSSGGLARFFAAPSGGFSAMCRPPVSAVARPGVA